MASILFKIKRLPWSRRLVNRPPFCDMRRAIDKLYCRYVRWLSHRGRFRGDSMGDDSSLCIVITAFNAPQLLAKQLECIHRWIVDAPFHIVVGDNSSHRSSRREIQSICRQNGVEYVGVPRWLDRCLMNTLFLPSFSHGAALNWLWHKVLKRRRNAIFAFLDHDIFPVHPCSLVQTLGSYAFHGALRRRGQAWYLWPGLALFKAETLKSVEADFLPSYAGKTFLDTGGELYHRLFSSYQGEMPDFPKEQTVRVRKQRAHDNPSDIFHGDCVQLIGNNWLHFSNVTNYAHTEDKSAVVDNILSMI